MTAVCLRADARVLPLRDASVDLVVTSPPYFALRSYTDGGEHYPGQIGSEATPAEYVAELVACTREWVRVLKPSGSLFVNLGDKYDNGTSTARRNGGDRLADHRNNASWNTGNQRATAGRTKSLLGMPWRYALACIDELGLILRAEIIWSKPNGLPESVIDRVRRSHETWFHLVRQPRYYAAVDEIRESHTGTTNHRRVDGGPSPKDAAGLASGVRRGYMTETTFNPLGKLPGSVWSVPSEPLAVPDHLGVDHFAAFPTEWPRRLILGWSPPGVCTACGEGRRPVADKRLEMVRPPYAGGPKRRDANEPNGNARGLNDTSQGIFSSRVTITGYACACPEPTAPTRPSVILDPFGGTGTTALVASVLGRTGISVDMSADYCRLAQWRTTNPQERAKAMRVERPPVIPDDQLELDWAVA